MLRKLLLSVMIAVLGLGLVGARCSVSVRSGGESLQEGDRCISSDQCGPNLRCVYSPTGVGKCLYASFPRNHQVIDERNKEIDDVEFKSNRTAVLGYWRNIDEQSSGITLAAITEDDSANLTAQIYGDCFPTDCVWEPLVLADEDGILTATLEDESKSMFLTIEPLSDSLLSIHTSTIFHYDPAGEPQDSVFIMHRIP